MERIEYRTIDKAKWQRGAWDSEPDKVQWPDDATGLPCLAVRHPEAGHWCGYVGVPEGHPLHGKDYSGIECLGDVHGGLTFASDCQPEAEDRAVCHKPSPGEPDHVWWFGFDCAHLGDTSPGWANLSGSFREGTYKTLAYVQGECRNLAKQLSEQR